MPDDMEFGEAQQIAGEAIFGCIDWNRKAYGNPACDEDAWWFAHTAIKALKDRGYELVAPVSSQGDPS